MSCGFCSKSIEGLKEITKPPKKEIPEDNTLEGFEMPQISLGLLTLGKIFQCQLCEEYWVSEVELTLEPLAEGDTFPRFASKTINTPRGYNLANIHR